MQSTGYSRPCLICRNRMLSDTQRTRGDVWCRLRRSDGFHACISVGRRLSDDTDVSDSASFCDGASGASRGMRCRNS